MNTISLSSLFEKVPEISAPGYIKVMSEISSQADSISCAVVLHEQDFIKNRDALRRALRSHFVAEHISSMKGIKSAKVPAPTLIAKKFGTVIPTLQPHINSSEDFI